MRLALRALVCVSWGLSVTAGYSRGGVAAPRCDNCPKGFYCEGAREPKVPCPTGHYCPAWAPGMNAKYQCPEETYNDETGKSEESDCKVCETGRANEARTACTACPAGQEGDGNGGCRDCAEFATSDGTGSQCKAYKDLLMESVDKLYANLKISVNLSNFSCNDGNRYQGTMNSNVANADLLQMPWAPWDKEIKARSGGGCSCVDIILTGVNKKYCEHLKSAANADFKAKGDWCSGYAIKSNNGGACTDSDANAIQLYYKKW